MLAHKISEVGVGKRLVVEGNRRESSACRAGGACDGREKREKLKLKSGERFHHEASKGTKDRGRKMV